MFSFSPFVVIVKFQHLRSSHYLNLKCSVHFDIAKYEAYAFLLKYRAVPRPEYAWNICHWRLNIYQPIKLHKFIHIRLPNSSYNNAYNRIHNGCQQWSRNYLPFRYHLSLSRVLKGFLKIFCYSTVNLCVVFCRS